MPAWEIRREIRLPRPQAGKQLDSVSSATYYNSMSTRAAAALAKGVARGRPREFDLDVTLDRVIAVFSERGYRGTSISDLTAATGLGASSLYKAFRDKRSLYGAAFERYVLRRAERQGRQLAVVGTGRERVRAMLELYAEYSHGAEGRRGCLVVASAVELATSDEETEGRVRQVIERYECRLANFVREGQEDGSIASHVDPAAVADLVMCVMQGMRVTGKVGRTRSRLARVVETAMRVLD